MQSLALAFAASIPAAAATAAAIDSCRSSESDSTEAAALAASAGGHRRLLGTQQHLGTHVLDRLEAADRLAELLAHLRIVRRRLQRPAGQPGGLGRQHRRRHVSEALRRCRERLGGGGVQYHARQWSGEIGGLQRFDRDAVGARVDQDDGISGGQQQHPARVRAEHVLGGARRAAALESHVGRQRNAGNPLAGYQRLQDVGPLDHQGGQCRRRDRTGDHGGSGLVDHRAQILDGAVGAALLLGKGNAEDP